MCIRRKRRNSTMVVNKTKLSIQFKNNWQLYVLLLPVIVYFFILNYMPMYGIQIAFKDYKVTQGIMGSEWVGFKHFQKFSEAYYFKRLIKNTIILNIYELLWSFPIPIILALLLNRIRGPKKKRFIQTTIYAPHFISGVVMAGMIYIFLSPSNGIVNMVMTAMGYSPIDFMSSKDAFRTIYISSGIWQGAGFGTILYIASLTSVNPSLYEAADIDGASVWQEIRYIDIPSVLPTIAMTFILNCGSLMSSNTTKALLLQTPGNTAVSDIIGVYVYNVGIGGGQFSYTSAIGLFTNIVNLIMVLTANTISKRVANTGLF